MSDLKGINIVNGGLRADIGGVGSGGSLVADIQRLFEQAINLTEPQRREMRETAGRRLLAAAERSEDPKIQEVASAVRAGLLPPLGLMSGGNFVDIASGQMVSPESAQLRMQDSAQKHLVQNVMR